MIESACVGTPIISSDCPSGPKEFIGKNENGFIFNSNDENSFKETLDNFLTSSSEKINKKLTSAKKNQKCTLVFIIQKNYLIFSMVIKNKKKILITGVAGFIGFSLARKLINVQKLLCYWY